MSYTLRITPDIVVYARHSLEYICNRCGCDRDIEANGECEYCQRGSEDIVAECSICDRVFYEFDERDSNCEPRYDYDLMKETKAVIHKSLIDYLTSPVLAHPQMHNP